MRDKEDSLNDRFDPEHEEYLQALDDTGYWKLIENETELLESVQIGLQDAVFFSGVLYNIGQGEHPARKRLWKSIDLSMGKMSVAERKAALYAG